MPIRSALRFLLAAAVLLWAGAGSAWAVDRTFDGATIPACTLSGNVYTCNTFPLTAGTDVMTIASGYTVNIKTSVSFGYNQSLVMSGTARLAVTGNLDIGGIASNNLKVSGGSLGASGSFSVGSQAQTLTADVDAASMTLGSGSTLNITGTLTATGAVTFGSHSTLNGSISAGSITTNSPTVINGDVKATTSFDLASGSTVNGDVTAPTVTLSSSNVTVNGSVTATKSLVMGSSDTINGDVTAGTLTMQASNAIIYGYATVTSADMEWAARITKTIYCSAGTKSGTCDCVTNNSGNPVNSTYGPTCASKPTTPILDHFLIKHDGTGSACSADPVTVTACANAACTSFYTAGVSGTMAPGGAAFTIPPGSSYATTSVQQSTVGSATLGITGPSTAPASTTTCSNTSTSPPTASCLMQFNGSPGMTLSIPDQLAGTTTNGTVVNSIAAPTNSGTVCAPAFTGTKTLTLSCTYDNPASGTKSVALGPVGGTGVPVACNGTTKSLNLTFDANGKADVAMNYPDAGAVGLKMVAAYTASQNLTATDQVVVAPAGFAFVAPPATITAGKPTAVTVQAVDANGNITPNFGKEASPESITVGYDDAVPCGATTTAVDVATATATTTPGVFTASFAYPEAGPFRYTARLTSGKYLNTVALTGISYGDTGCTATLPRSIPANFVIQAGAVRTKPPYYYSGQPIDVTVTAMNAASPPVATLRYEYNATNKNANDVQVSIVDPVSPVRGAASTAPATSPQPGLIPKTSFVKGVAYIYTADSAASATPTTPSFAYTYTSFRTDPTTKLTLRATESGVASPVGSAAGPAGAEDQIEVRNGRIRIGGAYGSAKGILKLPVRAEYFDGLTWRLSAGENFNIPAAALGLGFATGGPTAPTNLSNTDALCSQALPAPAPAVAAGTVCVRAGVGNLILQPQSAPATVVAVFNLGATGAAVDDCIAAPAITTAGSLAVPWLRSPNGVCAATKAGDPAARATFGVFSPETRRIIHVREVFN